jgi:hypothetical protein
MKKIILSILSFGLLTIGQLSAQNRTTVLGTSLVAKIDVTGKWSGKRQQYAPDKRSFIEVFEYEFDLKQEGNIVSGTTTIINRNGEYADMKISGMIVGNKLIFAETEVLGAARPEGKIWCFKHGELYFQRDGENLKLVGSTPSTMEVYNYPCSGGITTLVKVDNSNNTAVLKSAINNETIVDEKISVNVFPNPFMETATISYNLTEDSKVELEVYDMNGRLVINLASGQQSSGLHLADFDARKSGFMSGIFIIKLTINGETFSRQIVQMR